MQGGKNLKNDTVVGKVKPLDAFLPSRKGYVGQGRVIPRKTYHIFVISMVVIWSPRELLLWMRVGKTRNTSGSAIESGTLQYHLKS